jgi:cytochrome c oxidase subunit II
MQTQAGVPLFPEQASSFAVEVDALYFFCIAITAFFTLLIAGLVTFFAIKYRRRSEDEIPPETTESPLLEITWIVIPLGISMLIFLWGTKIFFELATPPKEALDVYVTGKQWMWKMQHIDGQREINQLHVPVNRPIRLIMTSEDVIHSYYIPAFRIKGDVLPGSYTTAWFKATKTGRYHLFCAEYCGTKHSGMIGEVIVMDAKQFEEWSNGYGDGSLATNGQKLFQTLACNNCHSPTSLQKGPNLDALFGKPVQLEGGGTAQVDESYLRESLLEPNAKVRQGFQPQMPTYKGVISEEQILQLIAYMKTLGTQPVNPQGSTPNLSQPQPNQTQPGVNTQPQTLPGTPTQPTQPTQQPGAGTTGAVGNKANTGPTTGPGAQPTTGGTTQSGTQPPKR